MGRSKSTTARGNALEDAVRAIESTILRTTQGNAGKTFRIESKRKVTSHTPDGGSVEHEIDIWVSIDDSYYPSVFIFECKNWNKRVGKDKVILLSDLVKVTGAQKGYMVASSYTSGAIAQASTDKRIELLTSRILDIHDLPAVVATFHAVSKNNLHAEFKMKSGVDPSTSSGEQIDLKSATFTIDGNEVNLSQYINEWCEEASDKKMNSVRSEKLDAGMYDFEFSDKRSFVDSVVKINGKPIVEVELNGTFALGVHSIDHIEGFEVAGRGRSIRVSVTLPNIGPMIVDFSQLVARD